MDEWVTFAKSMMPLMKAASEFIAEETVREVPSLRRVLDMAAGHGMFGIQIALRAPQAEIAAQDWPNVLQVAEANARSAGVANRYRLLPGDAFAVESLNRYSNTCLTADRINRQKYRDSIAYRCAVRYLHINLHNTSDQAWCSACIEDGHTHA
jgi:predicted nicotinamide N-methyase